MANEPPSTEAIEVGPDEGLASGRTIEQMEVVYVEEDKSRAVSPLSFFNPGVTGVTTGDAAVVLENPNLDGLPLTEDGFGSHAVHPSKKVPLHPSIKRPPSPIEQRWLDERAAAEATALADQGPAEPPATATPLASSNPMGTTKGGGS